MKIDLNKDKKMTDELIEDSVGPVIHINRPHNEIYLDYVRKAGFQKWELVGKRRKRKKAAARDMMKAFLGGEYKRGIVTMYQDYYGEVKLMEIKK